jgi:hypothetical protein
MAEHHEEPFAPELVRTKGAEEFSTCAHGVTGASGTAVRAVVTAAAWSSVAEPTASTSKAPKVGWTTGIARGRIDDACKSA